MNARGPIYKLLDIVKDLEMIHELEIRVKDCHPSYVKCEKYKTNNKGDGMTLVRNKIISEEFIEIGTIVNQLRKHAEEVYDLQATPEQKKQRSIEKKMQNSLKKKCKSVQI